VAENHRAIVSFARHALLGTLAGVLLGVLAGIVIEKFMPSRFEASVVLYHAPGTGGSDSGRDFIAATLARPDFLPGVAKEHGWGADVAAQLAGRIVVTAPDASRPLAEMRLRTTDETALAATLDAVAQHMITLHQGRQQEHLQWQLDELDQALANARRQDLAVNGTSPDMSTLPGAAHDAVTAAANLAREQRELELGKRFHLSRGSTLDKRRRELSLRGLRRQLERAQQALDRHDPTTVAAIERARALAIADAEIVALQHTRDGLLQEFAASSPLQLVRAAEVTPLPADFSPVFVLAAFGALAGLLAGGFVWSAGQASPTQLSAALVEKSLRVPVLAVIPEDLTGDPAQRVLAATAPRHLALAAIRSLRIALAVRIGDADAGAPIVISGLADPPAACLVIANLAVVAAQAGERILVVDHGQGDSVLARILAPETHFGDGSVRLAQPDRGDGTGEAHAHDGSFDRVIIHVQDPTQAREFAADGGAGITLLVCSVTQRLAALRKAQAGKLFGIVLCGDRIDEAAYGGGHVSVQPG